MLVYFFLVTLILFIVVSIVSNFNARQYSKGVEARIRTMEEIYLEFLDERVNTDSFDSSDLRNDPEVLSKAAVALLTPNLEGLMNFINKAYLSKVKVRYQSIYFPNIVSLCEESFLSKNKNPGKRMSIVETERLRMALYDAVFADLYQRIVKKEDDTQTEMA